MSEVLKRVPDFYCKCRVHLCTCDCCVIVQVYKCSLNIVSRASEQTTYPKLRYPAACPALCGPKSSDEPNAILLLTELRNCGIQFQKNKKKMEGLDKDDIVGALIEVEVEVGEDGELISLAPVLNSPGAPADAAAAVAAPDEEENKIEELPSDDEEGGGQEGGGDATSEKEASSGTERRTLFTPGSLILVLSSAGGAVHPGSVLSRCSSALHWNSYADVHFRCLRITKGLTTGCRTMLPLCLGCSPSASPSPASTPGGRSTSTSRKVRNDARRWMSSATSAPCTLWSF